MKNVSVIVPAFNDAPYIEECLLSVAAAGATEILVINDASTDETLAVLEALHIPQMRVISLLENSGPSVARNVGMEEASFRYCATVDADDVIPPNRLRTMLNLLIDLEACVILDDLYAFDSDTGKIIWRRLDRVTDNGQNYPVKAVDMERATLKCDSY